MADSALLPHDFVAYGNAMSNALNAQHYSSWIEAINKNANNLFKDDGKEDYQQVEIDFDQIMNKVRKNVTDFKKEARKWSRTYKSKGDSNSYIANLEDMNKL